MCLLCVLLLLWRWRCCMALQAVTLLVVCSVTMSSICTFFGYIANGTVALARVLARLRRVFFSWRTSMVSLCAHAKEGVITLPLLSASPKIFRFFSVTVCVYLFFLKFCNRYHNKVERPMAVALSTPHYQHSVPSSRKKSLGSL